MCKLLPKTLIENNLPVKAISELAIKEGNSKKPVYMIHKWWARRLGAVVRALIIGSTLPFNATENEFWEKFYSKNSLQLTILDPFMGGGTTLVEAKKMGAKTIGFDIDPLACFVTKKELETLDFDLEVELERLHNLVGQNIKNMYLTTIENERYPIINIFWVYELSCPQCDVRIETHPHYKLYYSKVEQHVFCKFCGEIHIIATDAIDFKCNHCSKVTIINEGTYVRGFCTCPSCDEKFSIQREILRRKSLRMYALEYEKNGIRFFKKVDNDDIATYRQAEEYASRNLRDYYIPDGIIPVENRTDGRPISHGYYYYKDLFNSRQLISLALLYDEIRKINNPKLKEWFIIAFSDSLASNNMLCNYAYGYRKLTPLFGIHAYTVPLRPVENNVWGSEIFGRGSFKKSVKKLIQAKKYCRDVYESKYTEKGKLIKVFTGENIESNVTNDQKIFYSKKADTLILNNSSENLSCVRDASVDLILTDPPYYDNIHYSELADFYYQWLKPEINHNNQNPLINSLYVNNSTEDAHIQYEEKLLSIFKECYLKLHDQGMMVFSYHHNKPQAWIAMGKAIKQSNFIITKILPIRSEGSSAYHTSENSIKWDSIIVMRKKGSGELESEGDITELIVYWENYFKDNDLKLKKCDKLSFYRSLAIQIYSMKNSVNLDVLIKMVEF